MIGFDRPLRPHWIYESLLLAALGQNHLTFINMLISVMGNVIVIWFKCHCNFIPYGVFLRPTFFL